MGASLASLNMNRLVSALPVITRCGCLMFILESISLFSAEPPLRGAQLWRGVQSATLAAA